MSHKLKKPKLKPDAQPPEIKDEKHEKRQREIRAQLALVRALRPLRRAERQRVIKAFRLLLKAELLAPGICKRFSQPPHYLAIQNLAPRPKEDPDFDR